MTRAAAARDGVRVVAAAVLGVVAVALSVVWVVGGWARDQVLDTDAYVAAVGPLAAEPAVRDEVARLLSEAVADAVEEQLGGRVPQEAIDDALVTVDRVAREFTASAAFREIWVGLHRAGHERLVRLLEGDDRPVPGVDVVAGRLRVDLAPAVAELRDRVAAAGLAVVAQVPPVSLVVDVADVSGVERARSAVDLLDRVTAVAPWAVAGCVVLAVALARRRARAVVLVATGVGVGMVLVALAGYVGAAVVASTVSAAGLSAEASGAVARAVSSPLGDAATRTAVAAAVVALAGLGLGALARRRAAGAGTATGRHPEG